MNIKEYLRNRLILTIGGIIVLVTILLGLFVDSKTLAILSTLFGIISFVFVVILVNTILPNNPPNERRNYLVRWKLKIISWVEPHESLKWLQGARAVEFLLLYIGITVGLCSLFLRLWLDIIS